MPVLVGSQNTGGGSSRTGVPLITSAAGASKNAGGGNATTGVALGPRGDSLIGGGGGATTTGKRVAVAGTRTVIALPFPWPLETVGSTNAGGGDAQFTHVKAFSSVNRGGGGGTTEGHRPGFQPSIVSGAGQATTAGRRTSSGASTNTGGGGATTVAVALIPEASLHVTVLDRPSVFLTLTDQTLGD